MPEERVRGRGRRERRKEKEKRKKKKKKEKKKKKKKKKKKNQGEERGGCFYKLRHHFLARGYILNKSYDRGYNNKIMIIIVRKGKGK